MQNVTGSISMTSAEAEHFVARVRSVKSLKIIFKPSNLSRVVQTQSQVS